MIQHRRLVLALALALVMLLAACSPAADEAEPEPAGPEEEQAEGEAPAAPAGDAEPVELTIWHGREGQIPADEYASFMERYPHITINYDVIPLEDMALSLLRIGDDAAQAPDYFVLHGFLLPTLLENGIIREISDVRESFEAEEPELYESLFPGVWEDGEWEGGQYAFSPSGSASWLYYRPDWFEEVGLSHPPTTWDEVLDAARVITEADPSRIGFATMLAPGGPGNQIHQTAMIPQNMGVSFGPEGDGVIELDSEGGLYYIDFYRTLIDEGLTHPEVLSWSFGELRGAFAGSQAAMYIDSDGTGPDLAGELEYGEEWMIAPSPSSRTGADGPYPPALGSTLHYIHSSSEHAHEVGLLWRWLSERDQAYYWTQNYQEFRSELVVTDPEFEEEFPWLVPINDAFSQAERIHYPPDIVQQEIILIDMMHDIAGDPSQDPADVAARYQPQLDALAD